MAQTMRRRRSLAATVEKAGVEERRARRKPPTVDSFQNFAASIGIGTPNQASAGTYGFHPLTRERTLLEWVYRGSWIVGVAVDAVADDMCKYGIDYGGSLPPDDGEALDRAWADLQLWEQLTDLVKWGRLYGGSVGIMLIDGQDPATPLRTETIGRGQFQGFLVLDRWMVEPTLNELVTTPGPYLGLPKYYKVRADAQALPQMMVHYSRVIRYEGVRLPYMQRVAENLWGMSIIERLWDRLLAFDSTTQGIAQLIYKCYLRWIKIKDMRKMIGAGGKDRQLLLSMVDFMRQMQSIEGISMLDADDEFATQTYAFNGLDTVLIQMGQQLAGALQIPLVRLFGQSPVGMNSTGESDLRIYYDGIHQQQETRLRAGVKTTNELVARSEGIKLPDNFTFQFQPLWQLTPKEKADIGEQNTRTVLSADELGIISRRRTLEELRQQSRETGVWATITDEEVKEADDEPPPAPGEMGAMPGMPGAPAAAGGPGGGGRPGGMPGAPAGSERSLPVPKPTVHLGGGAGSRAA